MPYVALKISHEYSDLIKYSEVSDLLHTVELCVVLFWLHAISQSDEYAKQKVQSLPLKGLESIGINVTN